jgi:transposase
MQHYVGLDVSVKETSVCIVDKTGKVIREVKVATEPVAILAVLTEEELAIERIGLEAGPLSQWLYSALAEAGLPVICVETRHMKAALSAQINKSDRNDARGIAQMMRVGLYRPVHVKTMASQKRRMLLSSRQLLQAKALDIENELRGTLRNFGLKVGMVGTVKFEARIRELVADHPDLAAIVEPLLIVRRVLREQLGVLHRQLLEIVRHDEVCRRLMTTPGVGPVVALAFRATVDVPSRFTSSKAVGAAFGLTPHRQQSGEIDRMGHLEMRRRHDAQDVIRGGAGPDDPQPQVVVAQGLGHEDCSASWHEARDRRCGATTGGHHASHVGGWHRVSVDQERSCGRMTGSPMVVRIAAAR